MNWQSVLTRKAFWIYYLRLFQGFAGDRVAACCDAFGVRKSELDDGVLRDLYQTHRYGDEGARFHVLRLPTTVGVRLEIAFQPYGPNEQFRLAHDAASVLLADVDVDDVRAPCFPLRDLPDVAARLRGDLAQTYGALLLYKLTYVTPADDLDALAARVRAALPGDLFTPAERTRVLAIQRRGWAVQQKYPRRTQKIDHPAWHILTGGQQDDDLA
jgi:hypothetical protein